MNRTTPPFIFLIALLASAMTAQSQSIAGDFECHTAGGTVGGVSAAAGGTGPDCEGWLDVSPLGITGGGAMFSITGTAAAACAPMPTSGDQFLSMGAPPDFVGIPGFPAPPGLFSPMPTFATGNTMGVWPFVGGNVTALEIEVMATDLLVSVDWILTNVSGNVNHFFEVLLVDPANDQILAPIVVTETANETFIPMVCAPPSTASPGLVLNDATVMQTSSAMVPAAFLGQMVKVAIAIGPTDAGNGAITPADVVALVDNIRFGVPAPAGIVSDELVVATGPLVPGATAGSITTSGTVTGVIDTMGNLITDPTQDAVIGASFTINGNLAAGDANLDGGLLSVTTLNLVAAPGSDELSLTGTYSQDLGRERFRLGGPLNVLPSIARPLSSSFFASPNRTGSGSLVLDRFATSIGSQGRDLSLLFDIVPGFGPALQRIVLDYAPAAQVPEHNFDTNGAGDLVLGVAGANPADELFNVFVVNPTVMPGQGSFYGIEYTPLVDAALSAPLGAVPFHVSPNADGAFFWGIPPGLIPMGTVIDGAAGTVDPATGNPTWISPVTRRTF